jgi:glycosyltransferase involved in cell wall biosynthesis
MYEYPPLPAGLSTQGELLRKGLREIGIEAYGVHLKSDQEKEWYYRWFQPDLAVGVGYWGYTPHLVLHTQQAGAAQPVPWLVADGYIANYREVLNSLPLILVTSTWVKDVYVRDGIAPDIIEVLPVGCDTDTFRPREVHEPKVAIAREIMGVPMDEVMLLTVGGDAASKGSQEVMRALALLGDAVPKWRYVCKVWPQARTTSQNQSDLGLAEELGIIDKVRYVTGKVSRDFMPYLMNACDIYCGPSRLEGFGMPQVEAGACGKPVIGTRAMAFLDTLVHGETAFLAGVAVENRVSETILGEESGYPEGHRVVFDSPRVADYRANVSEIAEYLRQLLCDPSLRQRMGEAGRKRAVARYDYRAVARQFVDIVSRRLGVEVPREISQASYNLNEGDLVAT